MLSPACQYQYLIQIYANTNIANLGTHSSIVLVSIQPYYIIIIYHSVTGIKIQYVRLAYVQNEAKAADNSSMGEITGVIFPPTESSEIIL